MTWYNNLVRSIHKVFRKESTVHNEEIELLEMVKLSIVNNNKSGKMVRKSKYNLMQNPFILVFNELFWSERKKCEL